MPQMALNDLVSSIPVEADDSPIQQNAAPYHID